MKISCALCIYTILLLLLKLPNAQAQSIQVSGLVFDAETNQPLSAANILVKGSYRGTISNADGKFTLNVPSLPATLIVRFIGYETQEIELKENSKRNVSVGLLSVSYEMEEVQVTGKDPAVFIMEQVIERKQQWRTKLSTWSAEAFTRQIIRNDTGIVSITESISTSFWDKERGPREVIKSKRQTENIQAAQNFAAAGYVPNMYDDNIEISGFNLIGVTHPKAIDIYDFRLEGYRQMDDQRLFDISVRPKSDLTTGFVGNIVVLDQEYALLSVDLNPGDVVRFPPPFREYTSNYKQQFNNFGKDFWLPVDVRIRGRIKISFVGLNIPTIDFEQVSRLTDYQVNIPLPDSLYEKEEFLQVDSLSISNDSLFITTKEVIPLTQDESKAYAGIDSTQTLEKSFKPSGFLARMADDDEDEDKKGAFKYLDFKPEGWMNRADGAHLGLGMEISLGKQFTFTPRAGYKIGANRWGLGANVTYEPKQLKQLEVSVTATDDSDVTVGSPFYSRFTNSIPYLLTNLDYFDYYWKREVKSELKWTFDKSDIDITVGYRWDDQESMAQSNSYDLLGEKIQRRNPEIEEGIVSALTFKAHYGSTFIPFAPIGQQSLKFQSTIASDQLGGDFTFSTFQVDANWRVPTFHRRRLIPNAFDFRFIAGISTGTLPRQELMAMDATLTLAMPFGVFKTVHDRQLLGDRYVGLLWEHNFRTVPFEWIGWEGAAKRGYNFIIHGGHGVHHLSNRNKTEFASLIGSSYGYTDGQIHEIGASISGLFDILRVDFAKGINTPTFYVGLSIARIF